MVNDALVFLDWAQGENDKVMHEGKSLTSFPRAEDTTIVDFVLRLGEDANSCVAPVWIGAGSIGDNGGLGF